MRKSSATDVKSPSLRRRKALGFLGGLLCLPASVRAQAFPVRPVRIIVPFVAGGSSDVVARLFAPRLSSILGQPVIIENHPGAAGNIAVDVTARAAPDGHTMLLGSPGGVTVNPLLYRQLKYTALRDLTPVSMVGHLEHAVTVTRNFPAATLAGFIEHARANPGRVSFGSAGTGTTTHLAGALFALRAGITLQHVSYRGSAQALTDLISGNIQAMFDLLPSSISQIRSGQIRALATTGTARAEQLPDVPTVIEAGLPGFSTTSWHVLMAPAGTSQAIVETLSAAVGQALRDADVISRLRALGETSTPTTPDATAQFLKSESARWAEVIRAAQITLDNS